MLIGGELARALCAADGPHGEARAPLHGRPLAADGARERRARTLTTESAAERRIAALEAGPRWTGALAPLADGAPLPFVLTRGAAPADRWLTFEAPGVADAPVRLLEATRATVVALVGPYRDPATGASAHTLLEGHIDAGAMWGTFRTLYTDRRESVTGTFAAQEG